MMKTVVFFAAFTLFPSFSTPNRQTIDRKEAKAAFALLNRIRQNPQAYRRELHLTTHKNVTKIPLRWNETLAKVAEARALDMARRNYFDHTDPDGYGPNYHIHHAGYSLNPDWRKRKNASRCHGWR